MLGNADRLGLAVPSFQASCIVRYGNSLVGNHFRILCQLTLFALSDLVTGDLFDLWRDVASLCSLVWFPKIRGDLVDSYVAQLETATARVLDSFSAHYPKRICGKLKLHMLVHLAEDFVSFGPFVGFSTERFEYFKSVFRSSSIYSNRQNPSRDIALSQGFAELMKLHVADGYIQDELGRARQCGRKIRELVSDPRMKAIHGVYLHDDTDGPDIRREGTTMRLDATRAAAAANREKYHFVLGSDVQRCKHARSKQGDRIQNSSWVLVEKHNFYCPAKIIDFFVLTNTSQVLALVDCFDVSDREPDLKMPLLTNAKLTILVSGHEVLFDMNVQPWTGGDFVMNIHSFHNMDLIYTLQQELIELQPINEADRLDTHRQQAAALRSLLRGRGQRGSGIEPTQPEEAH